MMGDEMECDVNEVADPFSTPKRNLIVGDGVSDKSIIGEGIPIVEEVLNPPVVGMAFSSWEEVDYYLRVYGKQNGFGIVRASGGYRVGKSNASRRNGTWTCEFFGKPRCSRKLNFGDEMTSDSVVMEEVKKTRKTKKCECPVEFYCTANEEGEWVMRRVVLGHENHNPTPSKAKNIATFRLEELKKNSHIMKKVENDRKCGVPVSQVYSCLARQRNGLDEMPFSQKDLHNVVAKERRLKLSEGDANAMVNYFNKMTAGNQNFFHMHRVDEEGRLKDSMWVDARSRAAYVEFGDVVCFDSTYLTNEYDLPFSNFVGVNHHGQSILLGCALLSHEDAETFGWLFDTWVLCMGGKAPCAILTDQDAAMRKALVTSMPNTTHRWCLWHIMQKFCKKLGRRGRYVELKEALETAVYDSLDELEFDENWKNAINEYDLHDDDWLSGLFEHRDMWVPAYLKHIFWAGMRTTQRVESINSFFDGYLSKHTRLYEFAERYVEAMKVRAKDEKDADDKTLRYIRKQISGFSIERVFQRHYTDAKFSEFQLELSKMMYMTLLEKKSISDNVFEYVIMDRVWMKLKKSRKEVVTERKRMYRVQYDNISYDVHCECKLFECNGILCRHIVKVYDVNSVKNVPEKYILRRWRKDVPRKHTRVKVAYHDPSKTEEVCRYDKMMVTCEGICEKAAADEECVDLLIVEMQVLSGRVDELLELNMKNKQSVVNSLGVQQKRKKESRVSSSDGGVVESGSVLKDPPVPKKMAHRTTDRRFISCTEKTKKGGKNVGTPSYRNAGVPASSVPKAVGPPTTPSIVDLNGAGGSCYAVGGIQMENVDGSVRYFTRYGASEFGMSRFVDNVVAPLVPPTNGEGQQQILNLNVAQFPMSEHITGHDLNYC